VLVVGDLVDDISVRVLDDVTAASDTNAEIRLRPGGSAGNVAAWLGHLGADVVFCGRAGADAVDRHTRALEEYGVAAQVAGDPSTTATIVLQLDREGERTMFVDRGANRGLVPDDVPPEAWDDVSWLHLTGYTFFDPATRPVATELLAEAKHRDVRVSVDPSSVAFLRAAGAGEFLGWIDGAELVLPNIDEARILVGSTGPQIDLDALAARFPHVVVTLGSMGAAYLGGSERVQITAPHIDVVDTTGAGDAFAAGFLARWIVGATAEESLDGGRAAAETCVTHLGARP
jgi:sugar/nucleoside kinase (ribokinase family)